MHGSGRCRLRFGLALRDLCLRLGGVGLTLALAIADVCIFLKDFFELPLFLLDYLQLLVKHLDLLVSSAEDILGSLQLKLLLSEENLRGV